MIYTAESFPKGVQVFIDGIETHGITFVDTSTGEVRQTRASKAAEVEMFRWVFGPHRVKVTVPKPLTDYQESILSFIEGVPVDKILEYSYPPSEQYIRERHLIHMQIPRAVGKTTIAKALCNKDRESRLLFSERRLPDLQHYRGRKNIKYLIFDDVNYDIIRFVSAMWKLGQLSEDFKVVVLST